MTVQLALARYSVIESIYNTLKIAADIADDSDYFIPEGTHYLRQESTLSNEQMIFHQFCSSLQNSSYMSGSIKFNDNSSGNYAIIKSVLFDFKAAGVLSTYEKWEDIYNQFKSRGIVDNGIKAKTLSNWEKYARGIYEGANYLENKNGFSEIRALTTASGPTSANIEIINNISKEITGIGFALTCDWLKECGCLWLVKLDVHIKEVYKKFWNVSNPKDKDILEGMFDFAEILRNNGHPDMTAYKLDRIIWLISSGTFFKNNISIGRDLIVKRCP